MQALRGDAGTRGAGNDFAVGQMAEDLVSGGSGDDELFGGPANDIVKGGDGNDTLIGNFGNGLLLGGRGDDIFLGDAPAPGGPPEPSSFDVCIGQQGHDLAVPDTCEREIQIEGDFVPPPEG
jgi:Ca2+-binding RTX toxin-like protein